MRFRLCGSERLSLHIQLGTKCDWSDSHPNPFTCGNEGEEHRWATGLVWTRLLCNIFTLCVVYYNVVSTNICRNTLNLLCLIKWIPIHATVSSSVSLNEVYSIYKQNFLCITSLPAIVSRTVGTGSCLFWFLYKVKMKTGMWVHT
jgi:hypothetical protein